MRAMSEMLYGELEIARIFHTNRKPKTFKEIKEIVAKEKKAQNEKKRTAKELAALREAEQDITKLLLQADEALDFIMKTGTKIKSDFQKLLGEQ